MDNDKTGANRKAFQNLPAKDNPQFLIDGKKIYLELREKYPNATIADLDNILNGLCAALTCLMFDNVGKEDHLPFLQLIYSILKKNL